MNRVKNPSSKPAFLAKAGVRGGNIANMDGCVPAFAGNAGLLEQSSILPAILGPRTAL